MLNIQANRVPKLGTLSATGFTGGFIMINHETFQLLWPKIKGGIRNLWGRLSDQELEQTNGDLNAVVKIVKSKYTDGEDEIEKKLEQLLDSFDNPSDRDGEPDVSSYHRRPQFEDEPYSNTY